MEGGGEEKGREEGCVSMGERRGWIAYMYTESIHPSDLAGADADGPEGHHHGEGDDVELPFPEGEDGGQLRLLWLVGVRGIWWLLVLVRVVCF